MWLKRKGCKERKLRHAELSPEAKAEYQGWKATSLLEELRLSAHKDNFRHKWQPGTLDGNYK